MGLVRLESKQEARVLVYLTADEAGRSHPRKRRKPLRCYRGTENALIGQINEFIDGMSE